MDVRFLSLLLAAALAAPLTAPLAAQAPSGGATKQNLDLPFDAGGEENEDEEEAPEIIVFYGQQYEGDGIFFSCDKSGSMRQGNKFQRLQQEVIKNLRQFSERVQFGIIFFAGDVQKFPSSGKPAEASAGMKAAGTAFVLSSTLGRGTCSKEALLSALVFANQSSSKRRIIIHLSDGKQQCPGHDRTQYAEECLDQVRQRNTSRVRINAVCIGPEGEVDEDWMRKLAAQNDGSYARIVQ